MMEQKDDVLIAYRAFIVEKIATWFNSRVIDSYINVRSDCLRKDLLGLIKKSLNNIKLLQIALFEFKRFFPEKVYLEISSGN